MAFFRYKLIEPTGKITSGLVDLPYKDTLSVISHLERGDRTTIYVKEIGPIPSFFLNLKGQFKKGLPRAVQAEFFNNLSVMLKAGMTLTTALEEAGATSGKPEFERDIANIISNIQGGATFSAVAARYNHIFPKMVVYLIKIGEETGRLDEMLLKGSEHLRRMQQIVSDTKQALLYPSFVVVTLGCAMFFWFYYVVPKILGLFKEMNVALPPLTLFLLATSTFLQKNIIGLVAGTIVTIFALVLSYKSNKKVRRRIDLIFLKIPVVGTIISTSNVAFISEYLSLLLNAGIDIMQSLTVLKASIKNEVYSEKVGEVKTSLANGESIADSFRGGNIFPLFVIRMINIGEMSGSLSDQLAYISDNYRDKLSIIVSTIGKTIEPLVLVVAGVMFAIIIAGLFLPIYDLISKVGVG